MHGLGNDFMVLDTRQPQLELQADIVQQLSDRRTGIGFDQLLRLREDASGQIQIDIVNADGSPAEQCGNGMRAIALLLHRQGRLNSPVSAYTEGGVVTLQLADVSDLSADQQFSIDLPAPVIQPKINSVSSASGHTFNDVFPVMVGNPHWVIFSDDPSQQRLQYGQELAVLDAAHLRQYRSGAFAQGCNVGFAKVNGDQVELCVWERGAGPTKACGSGACAAAWVVMQQARGQSKQGSSQWAKKRVCVTQPGGQLVLEWLSDSNLRMTGPAGYVYQGSIDWPATQCEIKRSQGSQ